MRERAHVGSASWIEATDFLQEFSNGSFQDYAEPTIEEVSRNGARQSRVSPAVVQD
jgi:hypothetical protein